MKRCNKKETKLRDCFPLFWVTCEDCMCSFKWELGLKRKVWHSHMSWWASYYKCNGCTAIFYEPMGR